MVQRGTCGRRKDTWVPKGHMDHAALSWAPAIFHGSLSKKAAYHVQAKGWTVAAGGCGSTAGGGDLQGWKIRDSNIRELGSGETTRLCPRTWRLTLGCCPTEAPKASTEAHQPTRKNLIRTRWTKRCSPFPSPSSHSKTLQVPRAERWSKNYSGLWIRGELENWAELQ